MSAVKDFERMFEGYLHSKAARAWRLGAGDRDAALAYYQTIARTGGLYLAAHPD